MTANFNKQQQQSGTCSRIGRIRVAPPLDQLGCKAVLAERGAVHDGSLVFKRVDRRACRHGDVLQGQPQSGAALVVFELQVEPTGRGEQRFPGLLAARADFQVPTTAETRLLLTLEQLAEHRLVARRHRFVQRSSRSDKGGELRSSLKKNPVGVRGPGPVSVPALAVLHVRVGSGLQQGLCDTSHAGHDLGRVFFGTEGANQVERGFYCSHGGCVHLSRVAN